MTTEEHRSLYGIHDVVQATIDFVDILHLLITNDDTTLTIPAVIDPVYMLYCLSSTTGLYVTATSVQTGRAGY